MSELIGAHRKKSYKKSFEPQAAAQKRHSAVESLRKDERLRTFSLRRVLSGTEAGGAENQQVDVKNLVSEICTSHLVGIKPWRQLRKTFQAGAEQTLRDALGAGVVGLLENMLNLGASRFVDEETGACCREETLCEVVWTVGLVAAEEQQEGGVAVSHDLMFSRVCSLFLDSSSNRRLSLLCCWALGNLCADPKLSLGQAVLLKGLSAMQALAQEAAESSEAAGLLRALVFMICNAVRDGSLREHLDPEGAANALTAVVQYLQSAVSLAARDDRRGALGEGLWCIAYLSAEQRFGDAFHTCGLYHRLLQFLSPPSSAASTSSSPTASETTDLLLQQSMFCMSEDTLNEIQHAHVDTVVPTVKILDNALDFYLDVLLGLPDFISLLGGLTTNAHRGIRLDSISLIAKIASKVRVQAVLPLLPRMVEVVNSAEAYDIKREAAWYLLSVTFSDRLKHLKAVMDLNAVPGIMSLLDKAKFDKNTVVICLDFLEGVMMFWKGGRRMLFEQNAIEAIEAAQFLHDSVIERRIAWMVEHYFDDLEADVGDISVTDEEVHGQLL
eukprot:GHVS01095805.1.p1 GENE.GHVS01095805.1~~GHVS01095805.1.p1  ORF type:complete len:556 (+),score=91.33 GHVS01095805.1:118-1785(+)